MRHPSLAVAAFATGILMLSACSSSDSDESAKGHGLDKTSSSKILGDFAGDSSLVLSGESRNTHGGSGFPASYAAPYLEMWKPPSVMRQVREASGVKYFHLAFIIAPKSGSECSAKINGDTDVSDPGWVSAINENRAAGGDVIASFGGAEGHEPGVVCKSVPALKAQYKKVIDALRLTRVDFDIEGRPLADKGANDRRNKALAELQGEYASAGKNLDVNYTLPVDPSGLTGDSLDLLKNARDHGVDVNLVNIMTMDYGGPRNDMGQDAVSAASGLHRQLKNIWPQKSDAELWKMQGNTPMIGVNDIGGEVFSIKNAHTLLDFAKKQGIQQLAFWAAGRDHGCSSNENAPDSCSGVPQSKWQFSKILNGITEKAAPAPEPTDKATASATSEDKPKPTPSDSASASSTPSSKPKGQQSTSPESSGPLHIVGLVHCESGRPIVGVWVQAAHSSDSHFAAWRGIGDGAWADWWTDLPSNESYSLHVGCGGTPASWASENKTGVYTGPSNSFTCNDVEGDRNRGKCTRQ
ncbi:chitinase [Streptomyces sp. NPDC026665]|uniref:chitinase n=1 Tax=Streptomyces sp. NPDC026665 TaxID=3154798 RepID=UPI0033E09E54